MCRPALSGEGTVPRGPLDNISGFSRILRDRPASRAARAKFAFAFAKALCVKSAIWYKAVSLWTAMHGRPAASRASTGCASRRGARSCNGAAIDGVAAAGYAVTHGYTYETV